MKKSLFPVALLLLLATQPFEAKAQFEGKIVFSSTQIEQDGTENDGDRFTFYITPERILMQGQDQYELGESIETEGILIRLDEEDFVLFTEDDVALSISRDDIDAMLNMMGEGNSNGDPEIDTTVDYERTGKERTINGYDAELFIFRDENDPDNYAEVWLTKEISVQWGMLADSWSSITSEISKEGFPLKLIYEEEYFPLLIESYEDDKLSGRFEAEQIESTTDAQKYVEIPSDMKVMNFQQYLFQQFGN